jgi:proline iminopeptidase
MDWELMIFMSLEHATAQEEGKPPNPDRNGTSMEPMKEMDPPNALHAPLEPDGADWLDVGKEHRICSEPCGSTQGLPVVFLHGGLGSGCSPRHRQLFDTQRCRVVMFDRRGCGRSPPSGSVQANTSAHLVVDIERLRQHLGLERRLVVGGSWGAGLALAYAVAHPSSCLGLVLRGVFLGRASDLDWFFPQARQLLSDAWAAWEAAMSQHRSVTPRSDVSEANAVALVDKYRVQSHYLMIGCFWGDAGLLARARSLSSVPTEILHGRLDWIFRPQAAWELHRSLPGSRLQWVDGCDHSPFEPAVARALAQAVAHHAMHGDFTDWGHRFPDAEAA